MPSRAISGRRASISPVTVKVSSMIGAGPFSRLRESAVFQPVTAISRVTRPVNAADSSEPYFRHSIAKVEPRPR